MYKHSVFGLKVLSVIELDAPKIEFDTCDLEIIHGEVPLFLKDSEGHETFSANNEIILEVGMVGRFLVSNGNKVTMSIYENVHEKYVKVFLDGYVISNVMIQRKYVPLHGSGISRGDNGFLVIGESGAGKSSLTTGLIDRGFKLLTDDVIVLDNIKSSYFVLPSFFEQKLSTSLIERYLLSDDCHYKDFTSQFGNSKLFVKRENEFSFNPKKLTTVIEMQIGEHLEIVEVTGIKKIEILKRNIYQSHIVKSLKMHKEHFMMLSKMAQTSVIYVIKRPANIDTVDEQIELLFEALEKRM